MSFAGRGRQRPHSGGRDRLEAITYRVSQQAAKLAETTFKQRKLPGADGELYVKRSVLDSRPTSVFEVTTGYVVTHLGHSREKASADSRTS